MDIDDSMTDIVWRWRGHKDSNPGTNLLGMQNISFWVRATLGLWEESTSLHLGQTHKHSVTSSRCQRVWMLIVHYSTLIGYTSSPSPSAVFAICSILKLPLQQSQGKGLNIGPQIRRHTKILLSNKLITVCGDRHLLENTCQFQYLTLGWKLDPQ